MSGQIGTIVDLDVIDGLGWIELDEGGRVRFGGSALKGFGVHPGVGSRVVVLGTAPGFKGVTKATEVRPHVTPEEAARAEEQKRAAAAAAEEARRAVEAARIPWADFVRAHPRWSDVAGTAVPCARPAPRPELPAHPLFAPWHREICETAPTGVGLVVPGYRKRDPIDPGPGDCFAHGRVAYLDAPQWPSCGLCARPLSMCVQISPAVLADFVPGGRGLVALYCFACGIEHRKDPRVGHVRLVEPRHRVVGPDVWRSDAERNLSSVSRRVTADVPRAVVPPAGWHRCRKRGTPEAAAGALFGDDDLYLRFSAPLPEGVDDADLEDLATVYDDWLGQDPGCPSWGGARLGGVASWEDVDETPSCPHGEMLLLLDYEGEQFLEGALHVFACRAGRCDLAFVATF